MDAETDIMQLDCYDCGAASLCSIAAWWGKQLSLTGVRALCGCTSEGISVRGLVHGAESLGFDAQGLKSEERNIKELAALEHPYIALVVKENGMLHYVAVYGYNNRNFLIMDPETGSRRKIPEERFGRVWSGIVVTLRPRSEGKSGETVELSRPLWRRILAFVADNWKTVATLFLLSAVISLAGIASALVLEAAVQGAEAGGNVESGRDVFCAVIILFVFNLIAGYIYNRLAVKSMSDMDAGILSRFSRRLLCLSLFQTSQFDAGGLMSRIADVPRIRNLVTDILVSFLVSLFTFITAVFIALCYSRLCAGLMLLFLPGYFILYRWCGRLNLENGFKVSSLFSAYQSRFVDFVSSLPALGHFTAGKAASQKLEADYDIFRRELLLGGRKNALLSLFSQALSKGMTAAILVVGYILVRSGELTLGRFVALYTMCGFVTSPLEHFTEVSASLAQAKVSWRRVFEIMDLGEDAGSEPPVEAMERERGDKLRSNSVDMVDLSFSYVGRLPLMEHVNASIPLGKLTVLYGANGCGKSTLASLIVGDYRPGGGKITIRGSDIAGMDVDTVRRRILLVSGSDLLWSGTLLENILCFEQADSAMMQRVGRAVEMLGMGEFIASLPQGLMSVVGCGSSVRLSNGQRQKVLLARAFVRDMELLVLDEATSALDTASERCVMDNLKALCRQGKGVLLITHNSRLIEQADVSIDFERDILRK